MLAPVMYRESSEAKKAQTSATSGEDKAKQSGKKRAHTFIVECEFKF